jgi:Sulfotransferase domain
MKADMTTRGTIATLLAPLHRRPAAGRRMTPGYLVVGTKRGGSTSLADWIEEHPGVAPCRNRKGTHFFDTNYSRGSAWYATRFERTSRGFSITGEASPYYMFHPLAPQRIRAELPDVKLIAVLRDPIDRAWSQYQYEVARGHESESFATALDLEESRLAGEVERLIADPRYEGAEYRHHGYLRRGHYADQLREIYRLFPAEQVLVVQSEEMFADPHGTLDRVWDFLGLDRVRLDGLGALNANSSRGKIDADNLMRLAKYYQPLNEDLYSLPGIGFRWEGLHPDPENAPTVGLREA